METVFLIYLAAVNLFAAHLLWLDWRHSKFGVGIGQVPEKLLLALGLGGGAFGILAAQTFLGHHRFRRRVRQKWVAAFSIHLALVLGLLFTSQPFVTG